MIENIIFDLDGTLLDTTEGVLESSVYAIKQMGFEMLSHDKMLKFVGPPIQNSFINFYGCDKDEAQKAANIFRKYYVENALYKAKPYEGIYELCEWCKNNGKKMAVATYKREDYAINILRFFGFDKYCISMHGADNENKLTKADIVELCIKELGGLRKDTVLVGDTIYDAIGAEQAGVGFIPVLYGFGFAKEEDVLSVKKVGMAYTPLEIVDLLI